MRPQVIFIISVSLLLFSCNSKQESVVPVVKVVPIEEITKMLQTIDSAPEATGEDFNGLFPNAKFERWAIAFAISGIEFDIWEIDEGHSLVLFPKREVDAYSWDERPTGVILEVDVSSDSLIPSKQDKEYFGPTSRLEGVGLDAESVYDGFLLIEKGTDFIADIAAPSLFSSRNMN